jgi:hypothetical protein
VNYFYEPLGVNSIPNFVRAGSPMALRRLMLKVNRKFKGYVQFSTPHFVESEGVWYAWYVDTSNPKDALSNAIRGDEE